ncbi:COG3650 family protein [Alteripontixanthobacter maritimus]|nr:hypothetical protein [Alteripontixanthobacter maritimus]
MSSENGESEVTTDRTPYADVGEQDVIQFTGTEPFWGGSAQGASLTYATPERPDGETIAVRRFAGNNGLGLSGTLSGQAFDLVITPAECSDGMSDRTYPFVVTLKIGDQIRNGCAWTDAKPFEGSQSP